MAIHRKYTVWGRQIDIGEGEVYCPECKGKGCKFGTISDGNYKSTIKTPCGFCQGYGKSDWIQIATNEPRVSPPPGEYMKYLKNNFAEFAALWITKEIDKEILDSLITSGRIMQLVSYEILKEYAKNAGVAVVTATQMVNPVLLRDVIYAGVEVILTGSILLKEQLKKNTATSSHVQVIKSRQQ